MHFTRIHHVPQAGNVPVQTKFRVIKNPGQRPERARKRVLGQAVKFDMAELSLSVFYTTERHRNGREGGRG